MIVSGFTQKSLKDEYSHGSPLDHEHCQTCVHRSCTVRPDPVTSCIMVTCPRGCQSQYHKCKGAEHLLLCPEDRVQCINRNFGCPLVLPRKNLSRHLSVCPASVVFCNVDWYRYNIHFTKVKEKNSMLLKKTYADCGQLDTALAMRDHRVLVDHLLTPPQSHSSIKTPLKEIYGSENLHTEGGVKIHNDVMDSRWDSKKSFLAVQKLMWRGQGLTSEMTSESAVSASSTISHHCKDAEKQAGPSSTESPTPAGISCDSGFSVEPMEVAGCSVKDGETSIQRDKQETLVRDGQALDSMLSLTLSRNFLAKDSYTRFTFLCAQELRRDQFSHHFNAVHIRIHPNLDHWLEQRCPLAYLGCPFSFRRFHPGKSCLTLTHSWLSESFGVTSQSLQADPMHRIPDHLLPHCPETVTGGNSSVAEQSVDFVKAVEQQEAQAPSSSSSQQGSESAAVASIASGAPCLSSTEQTSLPKEDFSSMMDSINLDNTTEGSVPGPSMEKRKKYLCSQDSTTPSGQDHGPDDTGEQNVSGDQTLSNQPHHSADSAPTQHHNDLKTSPSETISDQQNQPASESLSGSSRLNDPHAKHVIYTALSARSCIRVDRIPVAQPNEEKIITPAVGFSNLPFEVMRYLTAYLDSFSLYNLSLVSHTLREVCSSLLQERGIVSLIWEKQQNHAQESWQVVGKRWSFSTSFEPVSSWTYTGCNPIPNHLRTCPYNQDRLQHTDRFSLIPLDNAPLDVQIRDMLQKRLEERRNFRGWIIRSNFDRELVDYARPNIGPFADLLVALGGTLPP